ncbi:MAG: phosphoribosylamine--glycine ligase, partial [Candidatus Omnitrophica bacterium]|nr:phosphoribosylamine--glycine ligase [Candidatus Omnitrophota bacterium]
NNDQGPNTGGMGAYAPTPLLNSEKFHKVIENIFKPLVEGLRKENKIYKGIIYAGLMISGERINVLEFNVRLGDPEAQVILPKLKGDLANVFLKATNGKLSEIKIDWDQRACVCVVLASGGYPGKYQKGKEIKGIAEAKKQKDILIYHAGTRNKGDKFVTNGGRVLSVVALGDTLQEAKDKVYQAVNKISFEGMQYRTDIGDKALSYIESNK